MIERISVVIATYNGMKFIAEQLDSIRTQTLLPDEVIIADDKSSDGTYTFCMDYIERYGLTGWTVYQNERNLNIVANFKTALQKATGDYIFTCDQDDIWMPDKIYSMVSALQTHPNINLLTTNYIPLVNGKPSKVHMKYINRNDGSVIPIRLKDSGLSSLRPGCTFCFRRGLLAKFNVMDIDTALHDAMLWKYAIVSDSLYLLNRQLIFWRRHEGVATGVSFSAYPTIDQRIQAAYGTEEMYSKFIASSEGLDIPATNVKFLNSLMDFSRRRRNVLAKRSTFLTALFVMMNMKHYPTLRNALSDIYAVMFLK